MLRSIPTEKVISQLLKSELCKIKRLTVCFANLFLQRCYLISIIFILTDALMFQSSFAYDVGKENEVMEACLILFVIIAYLYIFFRIVVVRKIRRGNTLLLRYFSWCIPGAAKRLNRGQVINSKAILRPTSAAN
jgi:hypothetical protein